MMMIHQAAKSFTSCLGITVLMLLAGCFEDEAHIPVHQLTPAYLSLAGIQSVAVLPFAGENGRRARDTLNAHLQRGVGVHVLPSHQVDAMLGHGVYRRPSAVDLQRWVRDLQVDALIYGTLDSESVDERFAFRPNRTFSQTHYTRTVDTTLVATVNMIGRHGQDLGSAHIDVSDYGAYGGSEVVDGIHHDDTAMCSYLFPQVDPLPYVQAGCDRLATEVLRLCQPHYTDWNIVLFFDESTPLTRHAPELARRGQWQAAADAYHSALPQVQVYGTQAVASVQYNLGTCLLQAGHTAAALDALYQARRDASRPRLAALIDATIQQALDVDVALSQARVTRSQWVVR